MPLFRILDTYLLTHEVEAETADHYRRCVNVFSKWAKDNLPAKEFTVEMVNRFLLAKQTEGRSSYYRRSLRNVLGALLRYLWGTPLPSPLRSVKLEELEPQAWTAAEMAELVAACHRLRAEKRDYWMSLVLAAYYTGLERVDLQRLERRHIQENGAIPFNRHKTGKRVLVWIPLDLLELIDCTRPNTGPIWEWGKSAEYFRREFAAIVDDAGLTGTFKRLRKTAGTAVEAEHPGRGHDYLGHSRKIFETHYGDRRQFAVAPIMPRVLPPPRGRDAAQ
jgi:integrase